MKMAPKGPKSGNGDGQAANDARDDDPRESESAEIIDLASRSAFPAVAAKKGGDSMGMVAGIAIVAALGLVTLWSMSSARLDPSDAAAADAATRGPVRDTSPAKVTVDPAPTNAVTGTPQQVVRVDPAPSPVLSNNPNAMPGTMANPNNSPTIVFDASGKAVASVPAAAMPEAMGSEGAAAAGSSAGDFASRVGGVGGGPAQAKAMTNPATTVTQGTLIPAILETAIDTDVPGYVRAVVSQDVKSFNGKNVLIPRSSRLIGQYQSGLQAGQKRAYVIWTRVIRPDGASVNLQSPGIGFDGTTGLPGDVDSRFFQRFGSAMLLSVVGGLSAIGSGGASVVIGGGGQAAAAAAAQQDGQLGPVVRVRQGEPIRVFTARDLDFSGV
ncbi:TrbI/VirB10 family protein [Alteriqipengyuania lutimaris]|uniref:Type VI secretion protein n=1 Tax=Alteriqipengyuania lutimaris TaxID=1538146 RepID=A0A395LNK0_9SPHN|nr:TrbI/VirB10 family protein [Alteriqipengyuania lutimaris]MBB3033125.1 type IV secretion system protein VirB10 [Alteriqipengyuania lutimaris]RDS78636.1 type VI secretion protein [Alteriqipengyuania lutimaris]